MVNAVITVYSAEQVDDGFLLSFSMSQNQVKQGKQIFDKNGLPRDGITILDEICVSDDENFETLIVPRKIHCTFNMCGYFLHHWSTGILYLPHHSVRAMMDFASPSESLIAILNRQRFTGDLTFSNYLDLLAKVDLLLVHDDWVEFRRYFARRLLHFVSHEQETTSRRFLYLRCFEALQISSDGKGHFFFAQLRALQQWAEDHCDADVYARLIRTFRRTKEIRRNKHDLSRLFVVHMALIWFLYDDLRDPKTVNGICAVILIRKALKYIEAFIHQYGAKPGVLHDLLHDDIFQSGPLAAFEHLNKNHENVINQLPSADVVDHDRSTVRVATLERLVEAF